jgi:hypothetical protein
VLALAGFAAAGVFPVDGLSFALTTTIAPEPPTTAPSPDPAPPPPPPPRHVSPPPAPPAPSPPPAPVHVSPPPAPVTPPPPPVVTPPPAPVPTHVLAAPPKPHPKHPKPAPQPAPAPVPVSRGAGGPAPIDVGVAATPVSFQAQETPALAPGGGTTGAWRTKLFLLAAMALGFLLVVASALPGQALRPAVVHEAVVFHRLDLALVGSAIVVMVGALYLLTG